MGLRTIDDLRKNELLLNDNQRVLKQREKEVFIFDRLV